MRVVTRWLAGTALGVVTLAPVGTHGTERKDDVPDVELLLRLDLLREADLARGRTVVGRDRADERLRMLEVLHLLEAEAPAEPRRRATR